MVGDAFEPDTFAEDTAELAQKIEEHHIYLQQSGKLTERMHRKAMAEINDALAPALWNRFCNLCTESGELEKFCRKDKKQKIRSLFRGGRNH